MRETVIRVLSALLPTERGAEEPLGQSRLLQRGLYRIEYIVLDQETSLTKITWPDGFTLISPGEGATLIAEDTSFDCESYFEGQRERHGSEGWIA